MVNDAGDQIFYQLSFNNNNDNKNPTFISELQNINPVRFSAADATNGTVTVAYKGVAKQQSQGGESEDIPDGTVKWNYRWRALRTIYTW